MESQDNKKVVKAEVLRHVEENKPEWKKPRPAYVGYISNEAMTLASLSIIVIVTILCALFHVEMNAMSAPALIITLIIVIIMGILMGNAPSWVSLLLVAAIMVVGALTGMYAEVLTGVIVFLGTVITIKEKNAGF
ncbi:MAG: hypothetical protein IJ815_04885 [Lachnospiraceae bacterium]|nr:hypothetical protein [Lachnospiraceae bacterium]MCR5775949.1 hypothetical protein [Lachnospiraceae bacterium]